MTTRIWVSSCSAVLLALVLHPAAADAQVTARGAETDYVGRSALPGEVRLYAERLGARLRNAGRERLVLAGEFTDASGGRTPAQLVYQLPAKTRLQITGSGARTLVFDGQTARSSLAQIDSTDAKILESLVADIPEGLFDALRRGGALRVLGHRFRPSPRVVPNYTGPLYDVMEVDAAVPTQADRRQRRKRIYFDSRTLLLQSARYWDASPGQPFRVETRFSGWQEISGVPVPGRIERWEANRLVFAFQVSNATVQPGADDSIFRQP